jgi:hypothetical protein
MDILKQFKLACFINHVEQGMHPYDKISAHHVSLIVIYNTGQQNLNFLVHELQYVKFSSTFYAEFRYVYMYSSNLMTEAARSSATSTHFQQNMT